VLKSAPNNKRLNSGNLENYEKCIKNGLSSVPIWTMLDMVLAKAETEIAEYLRRNALVSEDYRDWVVFATASRN